MLKKKLLEQNTELFNKLQKSETEIHSLKAELEKQYSVIKSLKEENERMCAKLNATPPLKELEAKVVNQANVPKEIEYGASVIGKLVIEAAKACNILTENTDQTDVKELVNLILGRTEVAKAEILKIVSGEETDEIKKEKIDARYEAATDYFNSVKAQK